MDFSDNAVLIESLRKGKEEAYMYLLDKYHRKLYAYAISLIDNHAQAQDIVQNVLIKTWQSRKTLNSKYSIQSFLYKSIYNEFVNTYKKDKATMILQMKYYEFLYEEVEKTDEKNLEKLVNLINKEIDKLPPKCKQIFSLSKKEGLTNVEISEYLNISIKTVEVQITIAYNKLRDKLGDKLELLLLVFFPSKQNLSAL
jgi:RNA polymerase sigma-70 factor (ECF subfamily)